MFKIITDSEYLFNYLDNHFNQSIQFKEKQFFILNNSNIILIIYTHHQEKGNLIGFELNKEAHPYQSGMQLLQYLNDHSNEKNSIYLEAAEALHQHLLSFKSSDLYFDAH